MSLTDSDAGTLTLATPALVTQLQAVSGYPAVSLLMTTTPAARMLPDDGARLAGLAREAERRLVELEGLPGARTALVTPLHDLVARTAHGPAGQGIAVYVSAATQAVVHLTLPVTDRVVVDPTFATRDLVRVLHRTPRHVVLALSAHEARVFDGLGDGLRPAQVRSFPRVVDRPDPGRPLDAEHRKAFFRDVDRALGAYLQVQPAPLVLVGTDRVLADFRRVSTNLARLAGCVSGSLVTAPTTDLVPRIRVVIEDYLLSREQEALDLLERRANAGRVVSGIESTWLSARAERPEMLAVEEGFFFPARLEAGGDQLVAAPHEIDHPEVIDDAVDELIEAVLRRGGWVALTRDGALAAHGRVALTLRR